ncbi:MAG: putative MFS-type transporter YcaD [Chlamydiia bacterium]|nr:putative MFS-type transporter YcaD [Chlamydiia bacterium]
MTSDGFSSLVTGFSYSSYYAGMMLGAIYLEKVIHSKGHIRSFAMFAAISSTTIMLQSFFDPPIPWIIFRFFTGAGVAGLFIVIESWLLLMASPKTRGAVLSIYMIALYCAQSIGQFGINLVQINSVMPFNLSLIFCTASIIPVCIMRAAAPTLAESEYINVFYIMKKVPLGFFCHLTAGLALGAFYAVGPIYASKSGFSLLEISLVMAVAILGGMALQWPIGKLSDLFQRRHIIILVCAGLCLISCSIAFFEHISFSLLLFLLFLFGGFAFTIYPLGITYTSDFFSSAGITGVTAAALLVFGFGCIIGPSVAPLFLAIFGPTGLFVYIAILAILLGILAIYRQQKLPPQSEITKEPYHIHPGSTAKFPEND